MINLTSQYPAQTFLTPATALIVTQINTYNTNNITTARFPKVRRRTAAATAPDNSGAIMYQFDALIGPNSQYAYPNIGVAQSEVSQAATYVGNEYYIEVSPLPGNYYQILAWAAI